MEFGKNSVGYFTPELERDLIELMNLREMTGFRSEITMGPTAWFPGKEKVSELLKKAGEIANTHHPQSFSVSVGIPFGAQVSFTWPGKTQICDPYLRKAVTISGCTIRRLVAADYPHLKQF